MCRVTWRGQHGWLYSALRAAVLGLVLLTVGVPLAPAETAPGANPEINQPYAHPDYQQWVERFERPGREIYDQRKVILAATDARRGMAVADIGAGTGLFTRMFARQVGPNGKVYAVDISRVFVDNILRTAREQNLHNVRGVVSTQTSAALPAASIDLAFLSDTYHHFEQPAAMLHSIFTALRPGGLLVIVDYKREPGRSPPWILEHVRAGKDTVIKEVEAAGFGLIEDRHLLKENYFLKFRKGRAQTP